MVRWPMAWPFARPAWWVPLLALLLGSQAIVAYAALPRELVCYDDVFVPYFMQDGTRFQGVNVDILNEAASRIGIHIAYRVMPWRRLESELARPDSGIARAFAMSHTPAREQFLQFGMEPMLPTEYTLFVRDGDAAIASLAQLAGKTIGVRAGVRLPAALSAGVEAHRWRIAEVATDTANFQKLALKRIDAVLSDTIVGMYTLQQLKMGGMHPLSPPLVRFDNYLVFAKSEHAVALASAFDEAFAAMRKDGTMARLSAPYLGQSQAHP